MYQTPDNCPFCHSSLLGDPIPEAAQEAFGSTHFRRQIGIEIQGIYDGVLIWQCPECLGKWPRFTKAGRPRLHKAALEHGAVDIEVMPLPQNFVEEAVTE